MDNNDTDDMNIDDMYIKLPVNKIIKKYLCDKSNSKDSLQDFAKYINKHYNINITDDIIDQFLLKKLDVKNIPTEFEPNKIYTTIGVYKNGDIKMNGVIGSNIIDHIGYNRISRPGRALFIDGICIIQGYLSDDEVKLFEELFKTNPQYTVDIDTAPYH